MQHFIFDFDGTISDSYPMFVKIGKQIIAENQAENPFDDGELYRLFKESTKTVFRSIVWKNGFSATDFAKRFSQLQEEYAFDFKPFPEAVHLLKNLKKQGKNLYLYTHTGTAIYAILEAMGLGGIFDFIIDASMPFPRKPAPDALLFLMEKCRLDPKDCLMIGDRPIDVEAGNNAGMRGCLWDADNLFRDRKADYKIHDLAELETIFLQ